MKKKLKKRVKSLEQRIALVETRVDKIDPPAPLPVAADET